MSEKLILWISFIGIELSTLLADYFIKCASLQDGFKGWQSLLAGGVIYGASAIGWFIMMRSFKLFSLSIFHSLATILFTILLSLFVFKEKMTFTEGIGVLLGCVSIALLLNFERS
jgi:drug/metabolite transporter (DMT)-like permease